MSLRRDVGQALRSVRCYVASLLSKIVIIRRFS